MSKRFSRMANTAAAAMGHYLAFAASVLMVLVWAMTGPLFGFSTAWQLAINTPTTIITFLAVFLLQHSQNANTRALHLKLDTLIHGVADADDHLAGIENEIENC